MGRQSSTAVRTSSSAFRMPCSISFWAAGCSSSISMCIQDSRRAPSSGSPAARMPCSRPLASRLTFRIGCTTRCTVRPWRLTSAVTLSTRKGMSSVTISRMVWRESQPSFFMDGLNRRTRGRPRGRSAAMAQWPRARPASIAASRACRSMGGTCAKYCSAKASSAFASAALRPPPMSLRTCLSNASVLRSRLTAMQPSQSVPPLPRPGRMVSRARFVTATPVGVCYLLLFEPFQRGRRTWPLSPYNQGVFLQS